MSAEQPGRSADLVVVGAGAMGAWTAFWAQAGGAGYNGRAGGGRAVTMLDAWGTGHPRASSGDETRIIRSAHGADPLYTRWSRRARDHWLRFEREWGVRLMVETGVLWFASGETGFESESVDALRAENVPHERLEPAELVSRWPQIASDETLRFCLYEPDGGALMARRACAAVTAAFQRHGGRYVLAAVQPGQSGGGRLLDVVDRAGVRWSAETFVFACGPWLPRLFPEELGQLIRVTKQDVLFFGPDAGDGRFRGSALPAWADYDEAYYGIPAIDERGFKIAPDRYGPLFDPSNGERLVDPDSVRLARRYLRRRFPGLADRPVVESRVCQYEMTLDAHFLIDRHPAYDNVWIAGGGSGHGFKHGPRIGEYLVARMDGAEETAQDGPDEARFRLGPRVSKAAARTGGDDMASTWELF